MRVLYPGVAVQATVPSPAPHDAGIVILSVTRFDPRKNLPLAIDAIEALRHKTPTDVFAKVRLILAGYHDVRLPEAVARPPLRSGRRPSP